MYKRCTGLRVMLLMASLLTYSGLVLGQNFLTESFDNETFPPTGWTQEQVSGTGLWDRQTVGGNPYCLPNSGAGMIRYNSFSYSANTSAVLISPAVDLSETTGYRFQFWMYRDNGITSKLDAVDFYINTSNSLSGAYLMGTINRPITATPIESGNGWYKYEFEIPPAYNGTGNYILLKATSMYGMNIFIDDIRVYVPVAANGIPANFSANEISQTSIKVSWTDNSTNELGMVTIFSQPQPPKQEKFTRKH